MSKSRGYYNKFRVLRRDGKEVNPKHQFFVFNLTTDKNAREAMRFYLRQVNNTELSNDLLPLLYDLDIKQASKEVIVNE